MPNKKNEDNYLYSMRPFAKKKKNENNYLYSIGPHVKKRKMKIIICIR